MPFTVQLAFSLRVENWGLRLVQDRSIFAAATLLAIVVLGVLGTYKVVVRAFDEHFLRRTIVAVSIYVLLFSALGQMSVFSYLPRSVPPISGFILFLYLWLTRTVIRAVILRGLGIGPSAGRPLLVYGAGPTGRHFVAATMGAGSYRPVGFLDDAAQLTGTLVAGLKVHSGADAARVIKTFDVKDILLAMSEAPRSQRKAIIDRLTPLGVHVHSLPPLEQLMGGKISQDDIQEVDIADLLGRDPVAPQLDLFRRDIADLAVMVTGAGGSIGSELCRQLLQAGPSRLLLLEQSEYALYVIDQELRVAFPHVEIVSALGSVLEQARLERLMRRHQISTVYHAAAYKHVPLVEANPFEGVRNNAVGTYAAAAAAVAAGVKTFVLISTDKAVRPTNVMGASKRLAELSLQAFACTQSSTRFCMVRFGNVLGSSGSVVPLFRRQIATGGPLTVTHADVTRYFMTIPEAAQLVIQAGAMGHGGDVFVLDMGEPVRIINLARQMIHLSGLVERTAEHPEGDIDIVVTGLRPGEKLYEELLIASSIVEPTDHPRILKAFEASLPMSDIMGVLSEIEALAERRDASALRVLLQRYVEGYVSDQAGEDVSAPIELA